MNTPNTPAGGAALLPCPFCGKSARIAHSEDADGCYWAKVRCDGCGAETRGKWAGARADACPIFYGEVRDEWNTRPSTVSTDQVRALVEKWREESKDFAGNGQFDAGFGWGHGKCADELAQLIGDTQ